MLNTEKVLECFRRALSEIGENGGGQTSPRSVAVRAHALYCESLEPGKKLPALVTFRKFVAGKSANADVLALLEAAHVRPAVRAKLDRQRLRAVFEEAVRRLESRLMKGQARPLQIARRAYEIYVNETGSELQPSPHTFQRLIYGKAADPEIISLIESATVRKVS